MDITGVVLKVGETKTVGVNQFKIRELLVETKENYPQKLVIDFTGDKAALLDGVHEGQNVEIGVSLKGREYNGKYYTTISGWRIKHSDSPKKPVEAAADVLAPESDGDELPF